MTVAESKIKGFTRRSEASFAGMNRGIGNMISSFRGLIAVTAVVGLAKFGLDMIEAGDNIQEASQKLGLSTDAFQIWSNAVEQSGGSLGGFETGIKTLSKNIVEAAQGTGKAKAVFEDLGISVVDSNGHFRDTEAVLYDVAEAVQNTVSPAKRLEIQLKLLKTIELNNVLAQGAEGMRETAKAMKESGTIVSESAIQASAQAQDALDLLGKKAKKVAIEVAGAFADLFVQTNAEAIAKATSDLATAQTNLAKAKAALDKSFSITMEQNVKLWEDKVAAAQSTFDALQPKTVPSTSGTTPEDNSKETESIEKKIEALKIEADAKQRLSVAAIEGKEVFDQVTQQLYEENAIREAVGTATGQQAEQLERLARAKLKSELSVKQSVAKRDFASELRQLELEREYKISLAIATTESTEAVRKEENAWARFNKIKALANILTSAGIPPTDRQIEQLGTVIDQINTVSDNLEYYKDVQSEVTQIQDQLLTSTGRLTKQIEALTAAEGLNILSTEERLKLQAQLEKQQRDQEKAVKEQHKGKDPLEVLKDDTLPGVEKAAILAANGVDQLTDGIAEAIVQGDNLGEAMRNTLHSVVTDIAAAMVKLALLKALIGGLDAAGAASGQGAIGTALGDLLGFAEGGHPPVGKPSIVGEKGPELFIPRTSGLIVPNNEMGRTVGAGNRGTPNVTINVKKAAGTDAQVSPPNQNGEIEIMIVNTILNDQKRNGAITRGFGQHFGQRAAVGTR